MCDLISLTRDWTRAPAGEAQSLNHWTAGEFLVWANCNLITSLRAFLVAQLVKNRLQFRRPWFDSCVGKICRRRDNSPPTPLFLGFPGDSAGKESTCNAGDLGSIPGLGRFPGKGNGYPLQYSGLENSMDCVVHGVTKSWTGLSSLFFLVWNTVCGILFPWGLNLYPLQWKHRVLTIGLTGNSWLELILT